MKRLHLGLVILVGLVSTVASSQTATDTPKTEAPANEHKATIEGLVRDIACPVQNLEATATHLSMKCLRACAKAGSPLVILTKDGELYVPISDKMPDTDQRQRLTPFLGKYVRASGVVYERKGTRAIAINEIEEMKDVHFTVEGQ
jgi:DNA/RNA endonuclease YhcR with UshA esterase domain